MKTTRKFMATAFAALTMTVTGIALAPTASAAQSDCPRENVCIWNNTTFSGAPTWKSEGNLANLHGANGLSIFNNGVRYPGADHIWWRATWSNGQTASGCLHYPPDSGTSFVLYGNVTLKSAVWGGEC